MRIDLHMHSTCSDGTDTPEALIEKVSRVGLDLFSLTDHDAVDGCEAIRRVRTEADPLFVNGVEFSTRDAEGKYHILGYGYDIAHEAINAAVEQAHALRMHKVHGRLEYLADEFGFRFSEEDIEALLAQENPGKPHIANMMVRYGYAQTKEEAFEKYLNRKRFSGAYMEPETAVKAILASGGIPVLAHPCYGSGDELILGEELRERIRKLMGFGLEGLEGFYSGFTRKMSEEVLSYAEEYGLYVTAGSDYHGKNKLVQLADCGMDDADREPEGLARFLKHIKERAC